MKLVRNNIILSILIVVCFFASLQIIIQSGTLLQQNHYKGLAYSLLQGKFDLPNPAEYSATGDISFFKNKYSVYFGPTPAVLLIPFILLIDGKISQQIISLILFFIDFFLIYKIALSFNLSKSNCLWLTIFFMFGTIFLVTTLINTTAYQVQSIATSFFLLAIYEFFHRKRWLIIGFLIALAATTRSTFYLSSIFFLLEILLTSEYLKRKVKYLLLFSLPIVVSLLIISYYNKIRFDNYLDFGYSYNISWSGDLKEAASHGLFSIEHIPGNLYFLLFKGPDPIRLNDLNYILKFPYLKANPWGMGIFFTSPLFLYVLFANIRDKHIFTSLIAILFMLIPILSYYGIGVWQYGYRYAIDFYPLLFLILLSVFKTGLPNLAKFLIVYGIIFNFLFALSIYNLYPFFKIF